MCACVANKYKIIHGERKVNQEGFHTLRYKLQIIKKICWKANIGFVQYRGGVVGPAGQAGPLFSGSFVSSSDCRDSLRTTCKLALCSRFSLSFPLLCRQIRSPARPNRTASAPTHFDSTSSLYCRTLPVVDPPCTFTSIFYLQWPEHFWNAGAASAVTAKLK